VPDRYPQRRFRPPAGATEIVLVRHGSSAEAVPDEPFDLLDGHADPPLAPEGHAQARAVADRLAAEESFRGMFVTPLRRTQETAAPLAALTGLEPVVVPELREVLLGDWEGGELRIRAAKGDPLFARILAEERWDVIPNAEPMEALAERVARGLDAMVAATGPDASAVAFLHGGVIGEICRQATASRAFAFVHADNCSVSRLVAMPGGRLLLRSFNDLTHLPPDGD
jgi:2,3-bisphosphoglycerate-dependent phosphoglycerate mutase